MSRERKNVSGAGTDCPGMNNDAGRFCRRRAWAGPGGRWEEFYASRLRAGVELPESRLCSSSAVELEADGVPVEPKLVLSC